MLVFVVLNHKLRQLQVCKLLRLLTVHNPLHLLAHLNALKVDSFYDDFDLLASHFLLLHTVSQHPNDLASLVVFIIKLEDLNLLVALVLGPSSRDQVSFDGGFEVARLAVELLSLERFGVTDLEKG